MQLTARRQYGTRLLLDMAECYGKSPIKLRIIAKRQNIKIFKNRKKGISTWSKLSGHHRGRDEIFFAVYPSNSRRYRRSCGKKSSPAPWGW
ncbi:MAG: Rrf2 family transcriptional regulator [Deltaproteobacteria bacterium]|nr:Rrf2 family transcriptional regulator [Deltaproteobacteria bacterium]